MANWNTNPLWTPPERINGGEQFDLDKPVSPDDFNKIVENMQYIYMNKESEEILKMYPIGSIFMSTQEESPASLFGGTWAKISARFLVGAGIADDALHAFTLGTMGGQYEVALRIKEMPAHDGHIPTVDEVLGTGDSAVWLKKESFYIDTSGEDIRYGWDRANDDVFYPTSMSKGRGEAHNNIPPYLVVNMWRRIA